MGSRHCGFRWCAGSFHTVSATTVNIVEQSIAVAHAAMEVGDQSAAECIYLISTTGQADRQVSAFTRGKISL